MHNKKFKSLYIDLSNFIVTIFGGGVVGTRRAKYFLESGSRVRVVAKEFTDELKNMKEKIELIKVDLKTNKNMLERLISSSDIIVIATNDQELNNLINNIARLKGKLVNNAAEATKGNLIVPFSGEVYNGLLKFSITSMGLAGVAARKARDKILELLHNDKELKTLSISMFLIKKALKICVKDPKLRLSMYFVVESSRNYADAISEGNLKKSIEASIQVVETILGAEAASCVRDVIETAKINLQT